MARTYKRGLEGGGGLMLWNADDILVMAPPNTGVWRGSSFSGTQTTFLPWLVLAKVGGGFFFPGSSTEHRFMEGVSFLFADRVLAHGSS